MIKYRVHEVANKLRAMLAAQAMPEGTTEEVDSIDD